MVEEGHVLRCQCHFSVFLTGVTYAALQRAHRKTFFSGELLKILKHSTQLKILMWRNNIIIFLQKSRKEFICAAHAITEVVVHFPI